MAGRSAATRTHLHTLILAPSHAPRWLGPLAFASGAPALVYQVVWTREVALLAGSQIEALAVVLAAFFGGLALGAQWLGIRADRTPNALRLYGWLEIAAGALAATSWLALRGFGDGWLGMDSATAQLVASAGVILPITFLLGGTLPALLRAAGRGADSVANDAGGIVGANTAGAVAGVCLAVFAIPRVGLRTTLVGAGAAGIGVGALALVLARSARSNAVPADAREAAPASPWALVAAGAAGVATLGYEVLSARLAALQLGSSLVAWALVLGLYLLGLAGGNLASRSFAARSAAPARALGWIEIAAASLLLAGAAALRPALAAPAAGFTQLAFVSILAGVLPPAVAMGAAFPLFVRLAVRSSAVGAPFGRVSAINTAGGIVGALAAPFVLLPLLGSTGAVVACAAINAGIGLLLLMRHAAPRGGLQAGAAGAGLAVAAALVLAWPAGAPDAGVVFVADGPQATAVVATERGRRDLIVDGDPEASTGGNARRTEHLLAVLPLLLHAAPRDFLEVGLGSGITLGTARRFPLESVTCVELTDSVQRAAPYFAPDNGDISQREDVRIVRGDARIFLRKQRAAYDVIAANTLHPGSLGATGLYSTEYFARLAGALRPGGIAVQWVPATGIDLEPFSLILRTFFANFPHGEIWWGAENVILVGAHAPLPAFDPERAAARLAATGLAPRDLGVASTAELSSRRFASVAAVRAALGPAPLLTDDLPTLELSAARRSEHQAQDVFGLLAHMAETQLATEPSQGGALLWLQSRAARAAGDAERADGRERLAIDAGFAEARRARARRNVTRAFSAFEAGETDAESLFTRALDDDPEQRDARSGLAGLAIGNGDLAEAAEHLEALLADWPHDAEAWNELGGVRFRQGDQAAALADFERALAENPFYPGALANAGLAALELDRRARAEAALARLRTLSPTGVSAEERVLERALAQ